MVEKDLSNSLEGGDEEEEEDEDDMPPMILDDDFTTHGLERLSSAATCLVAGVEYTHGQQVRVRGILLIFANRYDIRQDITLNLKSL